MQIGKLAMLTGVSIRMLRYYESAGLLHPQRSASGYRHFTLEDVDVVRRIRILNEAGFTLPVVQTLLACVQTGNRPCEALKVKVREQLQKIDNQYQALAEQRNYLTAFLRE